MVSRQAADVCEFGLVHRVEAGLEDLVANIVEGGAVVMDAADEGEFVGLAGHAGEELCDFHTGDVGANGFPRAAYVAGSVGFGVPCIDLGGASDEKQEDDRFGGFPHGTHEQGGG